MDRTPGYPAFLAILLILTKRDLHLALILQAAILSLSVPLLYLLARKILPPMDSFVGAFIASLSPWGAVLAGVAMTEGLFMLLLALIFLFMKLLEESNNSYGIMLLSGLIGILAAAAILVRPLWPFMILVALGLIFMRGRLAKKALAVAVMLLFGIPPLLFWIHRNATQIQYVGMSTVSARTAWFYLAQRVTAHVQGRDRYAVSREANKEAVNYRLYPKQADELYRQRASAVFREYPLLTVGLFFWSALEHLFHPEARVLDIAKLGFPGVFWLLAIFWGGLLTLSIAGAVSLRLTSDDPGVDRRWILIILMVVCSLTLASGITFGAASRMRAPMELIVPLLAAVGLVRVGTVIHARSLSWRLSAGRTCCR